MNVYTDVSMSQLNVNPEEMKRCITEIWLLLTDGFVSDGKEELSFYKIFIRSVFYSNMFKQTCA